jgi:hypothetical protein
MLLFFNIRSVMISKYLELVKRQAQDRYGRFTSPSSRTTPSPSHQEVGSSNRFHTAPPPSRHEEASSDDSIEMWVVCHTTPPLCLVTPPPPPTRLVWLLLLRHMWRRFHPMTPPRTLRAITTNVSMSKR